MLTPAGFQGFKPEEIERVTSCIGVQVKTFAPKEVIAHAGERSTSIGVVIDGAVLARNIDSDGDRLLLDVNGRSEAFGADILWATGNITNYTVCALNNCQVLMVGIDKIIHAEGALCELRTRVVENSFSVMTEKPQDVGTFAVGGVAITAQPPGAFLKNAGAQF